MCRLTFMLLGIPATYSLAIELAEAETTKAIQSISNQKLNGNIGLI